MRVQRWLRPHRSVLVLLLAVTLVPATALIWVSWRVIEQDRALAEQRLQERLDHAADAAVSTLDRRLADLETQLSAPAATPPAALPDGAVLIAAGASALRAHPQGRLLWLPGDGTEPDPLSPLWLPGERLEFQQRDYAGAAAAFRAHVSSGDPAIRAAALVRLGRVLRKTGRSRDALAAYDALERLGSTQVGGAPAELVAEYGRVLALRDGARAPASDSWRDAATRLYADLHQPRWAVDRATYEFYESEVRGWLGGAPPQAETVALSIAADLARQRWNAGDAGRAIVEVAGRPFVTLWRRHAEGVSAFVAGPDYVESQWRAAVRQPPLAVELLSPDARAGRAGQPASAAVRAAAETGLPFTVRVASVDPAGDLAALATPRRLLVWALALIACLVSLGVYAVARAITRELAVARLQSNFVAAVSHEFRSPVTALRHMTDMLASGAVADEGRLRRYYASLARETERLHQLVEGLLDFGRMEAGRREYRFEPLDAPALVEHVVAEFAQQDAAAHRRVEVTSGTLAPHERAIRGDSGALTRAVWNLLDNAVKYSPPDSTVRVDLSRDNGRLCIHVGDEGPGIADDERADIFERFVRGRAARDAHVGGTGLGLAIVRHIVTAHGGDVTIDSEPGRGSRFTIALPAESRPL